jgi:AraC family transcriptional regulator of adaptative response/methylated-DNA-[protein]-cysteine methyltransferase
MEELEKMDTSSSTYRGIVLRTLQSPLGPMLGGATVCGVCLCEFSDRGGKDRIIGRLRKRHGTEVWDPSDARGNSEDRPGVDLDSIHKHLGSLESQLADYFAGTRREFDLVLDLAGTPWQRKVWSALLEIPYGTTTSYGKLAASLGKPGGSRAVGRANGDNYVAIVVPCHRVVQSDGGLRGYGGGLHRKRWLLDLEAGVQQLTL